MGMFDWFHTSNAQAEKFACRKCAHPIRHMQTKDFDCMLLGINLLDDGSLTVGADEELADETPVAYRIIKDTRYAYVYSPCAQCNTWNEWRLHVVKGVVIESVRAERISAA